jgi:adenylate kinase
MPDLTMSTADQVGTVTGPKVIVLGRQGAGKGTQCVRLATHLGVPHISTGDLFRAAIAAGTPFGIRAQEYVNRGALVPDDLVLDLVSHELGSTESRRDGYLLDGFPRTLAQGQALFEVLGAGAADLAVELDVATDDVLPRLAMRRVCGECGNVTTADEESVPCPLCDGTATRRADDTDEAIAHRLSLYDRQSGPLLVWLAEQGLLVTVDGLGSPDVVFDRLRRAVEPRLTRLHAAERTRSLET